jgi:hypothetical protein
MLRFCQAMFNAIFTASHVEHVCYVPGGRAILVTGRVRELDSVVGENCMDFITVPDSFQNTNSINGFRGLFGLNRAII